MFRFAGILFSVFFFLSPATWAKVSSDVPASVSTVTAEDIKTENTVYVYASRLPALKIAQNKTSSNTTVVSKEKLAAIKPQNFQEAVQEEEGVSFYDAVGNGLDTTFSMRGFNKSSAVTFLVDGVRVNELDGNAVTFPLLSTHDLESIQIDRGSASPVYGSSTLAGVVNVTTGKPSTKPWSLFGGLDVSSHHGINFFQGLSGTAQDKLSGLGGAFEYYFKGGRNVGDGFRGNSDYRITDFDIKTGYVLPEESGKFYINVKTVNDLISNPGELTREQYDASVKRTNKQLDFRKFISTIVQLGADKKFWNDKITASIMTNWRLVERSAITTFGTFTDFTTGSNPDTNFVGSKSRNNDLIWQLAYDDEWDWVRNHSLVGMEFRRGGEFANQMDAPQSIINTAALEADRVAHIQNQALFWTESLGLTQYADVHVGMRHDSYGMQSENKIRRADSFSKRWNHSTLNTGLTLHPHESTDVFFNYAQGFRIPDISDINPFGGNTNADLRPETSSSYEVGSRYHYKDWVKLRSSWFLIDMNDEIVFDGTSITALNSFGQNTNIGKSRRHGIETGIDFQPLREVSFFGTYTLTHAYVRETNGSGSLVDGRSLGQIPQHRMTWGTEVNPLIRLGEPFAGLKLRVDGAFTGEQHPQSFESTSQATLNTTGGAGHIIKSYTLWNFLASYKFMNQEIYFKINNMFDNKYYSRAVAATSFGTTIYPAGTYTFVNPGAPREYLMGLRWEIE